MPKSYDRLSEDYKMNMSEFKGAVLQSLSDIRSEQVRSAGEMTSLKNSFQSLEAGRLSRLETRVAQMYVGVAILAIILPVVINGIIHYVFK